MPINYSAAQMPPSLQPTTGAEAPSAPKFPAVSDKVGQFGPAIKDPVALFVGKPDFMDSKSIKTVLQFIKGFDSVIKVANGILFFADTIKTATNSMVTKPLSKEAQFKKDLSDKLEMAKTSHECCDILQKAQDTGVCDIDFYQKIPEELRNETIQLAQTVNTELGEQLELYEQVSLIMNADDLETKKSVLPDALKALENLNPKSKNEATELLAKALISKEGISCNLGGTLSKANNTRSEALELLSSLPASPEHDTLKMKMLQIMTADLSLVSNPGYSSASPEGKAQVLEQTKSQLTEIASKAEGLGLFRMRNETRTEIGKIDAQLTKQKMIEQYTDTLVEVLSKDSESEVDVVAVRKAMEQLVDNKTPGAHKIQVGDREITIVTAVRKNGEVEHILQERKLASGAAGDVFMGTRLNDGTHVALKAPLLLAGMDEVDSGALAENRHEAEIIALLNQNGAHPGIPQAEMHGDIIVMELFSKGDFQDQISARQVAGKNCFQISMEELPHLNASEHIANRWGEITQEIMQAKSTEERASIIDAYFKSDLTFSVDRILGHDKSRELMNTLDVPKDAYENPQQLIELLGPSFLQLGEKVINKISQEFIQLEPQHERAMAANHIGALRLMHKAGIIHGDIKPKNDMWNGVRSVTADFGTAKILSAVNKLMRPELKLKNQKYDKADMRKLVEAITSENAEKIKEHAGANPKHLQTLADIGAVKIKNGEFVAIKNHKALGDIKTFLQEEPPINLYGTPGYSNGAYLIAIKDCFYQGNEEGCKLFAVANDYCAQATDIYERLTAGPLPTDIEQGNNEVKGTLDELKRDNDGKTFYDRMEAKLIKNGVAPEAANILRRMAEPVKFDRSNPPGDFHLPVTDKELARLEELLKQGAPE